MESITASNIPIFWTQHGMEELQTIDMEELQTMRLVLLDACQELKARQKSLEELDHLDDLPEQDYRSIEADISTWHTRFIALLEDILPKEDHQEWLGDLREQHYQLIKDGTPLWNVYFISLFTGLGLIRSYLWLKADKFISRWMTRAK